MTSALCVPEFADERVWCRDLQALKAFVWIEFVIRASRLLLVCFFCLTHPLKYSSRSPTHSTSSSPNIARGTSTSGGPPSPVTRRPATPMVIASPTCARATDGSPAFGHGTGACNMGAQRTKLSRRPKFFNQFAIFVYFFKLYPSPGM